MTAQATAVDLAPTAVLDEAAARLTAIVDEMPPGRPYLFVRTGEVVIAWCADHQNGPDTWCRFCSMQVIRDPRLAALWAAFTPAVLSALRHWLIEASLREANYQAGIGPDNEMFGDAPHEGEEAYDALVFAEALLNSGPAERRGSAGPGGPDG